MARITGIDGSDFECANESPLEEFQRGLEGRRKKGQAEKRSASKKTPAKKPKTGPFGVCYVVGMDTEFQTYVKLALIKCSDGIERETPVEDKQSELLCYTAYIFPWGGPDKGVEVYIPVEGNAHKITIESFLARVFRAAIDAGIADRGVLRLSKMGAKKDKVHVYLAAHFSRADLPMLKDFDKKVYRLEELRGKLHTGLKGRHRTKDIVISKGARGLKFCAEITHVDTMLYAPTGDQSLASLGRIVGLEKLAVEGFRKDEMKRFKAEDPDQFRAYAVRDAVIAARYTQMILNVLGQQMGRDFQFKLPPLSLGTFSVTMIQKIVREITGKELNWYLGKEVPAEDETPDEDGYYRVNKRNKNNFCSGINAYYSLIANGYFGGLNTSFMGGLIVGLHIDCDLPNAYPTAMADIEAVDFTRPTPSNDPALLADISKGLSVAHISFKHPDGIKYPVIPVSDNKSLYFPMEGDSAYVCTPELKLARELGVEIKVHEGIHFPYLTDVEHTRFLEGAVKHLIDKRKTAANDGQALLALIYKEVANSAYGKIGQDVSSHKTDFKYNDFLAGHSPVYSLFDDSRGELGPSPITNPLYAGTITSKIRAVANQVMNALPDDVYVTSFTTDGGVFNRRPEDMELKGSLIDMFLESRRRLTGEDEPALFEVKGMDRGRVQIKTRVGVSTEFVDGEKPIVAATGFVLSEREYEEYLGIVESDGNLAGARYKAGNVLEHIMGRDRGSKLLDWSFNNVRDQVNAEDKHLKVVYRWKSAGFDYDFKRIPINIRGDEDGLARFDTRPPRDVDESLSYRELLKKWSKQDGGRVLKTAEDFRKFMDYAGAVLKKEIAPSRRGPKPLLAPLVRLVAGCSRVAIEGPVFEDIKAETGMRGVPLKDFRGIAEVACEVWPGLSFDAAYKAVLASKKHKGIVAEVSEKELEFARRYADRAPWVDFRGLMPYSYDGDDVVGYAIRNVIARQRAGAG